jgi:hypothetical protein
MIDVHNQDTKNMLRQIIEKLENTGSKMGHTPKKILRERKKN